MNPEMLAEVRDHFAMLQGCCLHLGSSRHLNPESIAEVLAVKGDYPRTKTDISRGAALKFVDGKYGLLIDSEDYTGHGCQCSADLSYFDDEASVRHALNEARGNRMTASVYWTDPYESTYHITATVHLDRKDGYDTVEPTEVTDERGNRLDVATFFDRPDAEAAWESIRARLTDPAIAEDRWFAERKDDA